MIIDFPRAAVVVGLLFFVWIIPANGQQNSFATLVRKAYGQDQELVNGVQYYNRYVQVQGNPYFLDDNFVNGSVILKGHEFFDVRIRYDLYSQQLELEYESFSGASNSLVTVYDQVDGFMNGDYWFKKLNLDGEQQFYQVIRTEQFSCYVHWKKATYSTIDAELYTEAVSRYLIQLKGELQGFRNKKTFVGCFNKSRQKEIKRLLRQKRIKFRGAAPDEIVRTMHAVSDLLNSGISP